MIDICFLLVGFFFGCIVKYFSLVFILFLRIQRYISYDTDFCILKKFGYNIDLVFYQYNYIFFVIDLSDFIWFLIFCNFNIFIGIKEFSFIIVFFFVNFGFSKVYSMVVVLQNICFVINRFFK